DVHGRRYITPSRRYPAARQTAAYLAGHPGPVGDSLGPVEIEHVSVAQHGAPHVCAALLHEQRQRVRHVPRTGPRADAVLVDAETRGVLTQVAKDRAQTATGCTIPSPSARSQASAAPPRREIP